MHRIEVDFLRDRRPRRSLVGPAGSGVERRISPPLLARLQPLLQDPALRLGVGLPGLGLLASAALLGQALSLTVQERQVQDEIAQLQPLVQQAQGWQARLQQAQQETRDLDQVFRQAQSWNGLLADLAQRTPEGVQILRVQEEKGVLSLQGRASRYPDVVALLRNLRGANFLDPKARLVIDSARETVQEYRPPGTPPESPPIRAVYVEFSLSGRLRSPFPVAPRS